MRQLANHGYPEIIFKNGKIITVDDSDRIEQALAVSAGQIIAVGSDEAVTTLAAERTAVIDLGGKVMIPGIIDSHNHVVAAGRLMEGVMLFDASDMDGLKHIVQRRAATLAKGEWIEGGGWIESQFSEYRAPTRWDLDEASPEHPVVLRRLFGASVANSKALELAGIDRNTPDPERGTIERCADGEPTGVLRNGADSLVMSAIPRGSMRHQVDTIKRLISLAAGEYTKWGITTVLDPGVPPIVLRAYQELFESGKLPLRVSMMPAWWGLSSVAGMDMSHKVPSSGVYSGFGNDWLRLCALKMAIDGGLGSKTALLNWPFKDGTWSTIPLRLDITKLRHYFTEAHNAGWSIGIHCCGDKAQDIASRCFDEVISAAPRQNMRHNIIHGYFPTEESLAILEKHGIAVSAQPGFIYVEGDIYYDVVHETKLSEFTPLKTYLSRGIMVAANSDMTSAHYNPFLGMYSAVARKTIRGRVMGESERLGRLEMLRLFTQNGAYLTFEETRKGSIEPGKLADLAVLSDDILQVPDEQIKHLTVLMTMIDGKVVHDAVGIMP